MSTAKLETEIERLLETLGYELVTLERGGGRGRPLLRLRIDRPDSEPGRSSITADDCGRVSASITGLLDESEHAPSDYILEVSSPGVERPLVRPRDFDRFAGESVRIRGYAPLVPGRKELVGRLLGRTEERVSVEVDGERVEVPLESIAKARLVYRWEDDL